MASDPLFQNARVLIIDDESLVINFLKRVVEMVGCVETNVRVLLDSRETLDVYKEFQPDIILLDLHMPHIDGFKIMELLQQQMSPEEYVPILVLTGDRTADAKSRALQAGAKDFLTKPLDRSEVIVRMKNLLETRSLHKKLHQIS